MKLTLTSILIFSSIYSFGQIVNSNKTNINDFYDGEVKNIEINGAKVKGQFKIKNWPRRYRYKNQPEITSANKNNTFFLNIGITNTTDFLNLNKLNFKNNNGFTFGVTFQHAFKEIYLAKDSIKQNPHPLQSFTISIDYQQDKFNNFDPTTQQISKVTPDKLSLKAGWGYYIFNYKNNIENKFSLIPSIYFNSNLIGYNESSLSNYILTSNSSTAVNILQTNNSSFDGKYGTINNNIKSANLSLSLPLVPENGLLKRFPIISPIPYVSYQAIDKTKPLINAGIAFGLLSSSIVDSKSNKKEGSFYKSFNVPSFLTVGIDWNYQNGKGSQPNYFISGSIKIK